MPTTIHSTNGGGAWESSGTWQEGIVPGGTSSGSPDTEHLVEIMPGHSVTLNSQRWFSGTGTGVQVDGGDSGGALTLADGSQLSIIGGQLTMGDSAQLSINAANGSTEVDVWNGRFSRGDAAVFKLQTSGTGQAFMQLGDGTIATNLGPTAINDTLALASSTGISSNGGSGQSIKLVNSTDDVDVSDVVGNIAVASVTLFGMLRRFRGPLDPGLTDTQPIARHFTCADDMVPMIVFNPQLIPAAIVRRNGIVLSDPGPAVTLATPNVTSYFWSLPPLSDASWAAVVDQNGVVAAWEAGDSLEVEFLWPLADYSTTPPTLKGYVSDTWNGTVRAAAVSITTQDAVAWRRSAGRSNQ